MTNFSLQFGYRYFYVPYCYELGTKFQIGRPNFSNLSQKNIFYFVQRDEILFVVQKIRKQFIININQQDTK